MAVLVVGASCALFKEGSSDARVDVAVHPEDPTLGPPTAPVRIFFFADFQ